MAVRLRRLRQSVPCACLLRLSAFGRGVQEFMLPGRIQSRSSQLCRGTGHADSCVDQGGNCMGRVSCATSANRDLQGAIMSDRAELDTVCPNNHNLTLSVTKDEFEGALKSGSF